MNEKNLKGFEDRQCRSSEEKKFIWPSFFGKSKKNGENDVRKEKRERRGSID